MTTIDRVPTWGLSPRLLQWDTSLLQFRDYYGWTPLDTAVYLGYENLVSELLIHVDSSSKGMNLAHKALLIAASAGHVSVMKLLMLHSPSCWDTVNDKRKNVLHVAIEHMKKDVIEYLLDECPTTIGILLAQKDKEGNTALHLLVISNFYVPKLIQHPRADKEALNYKGFTPLDLGTYSRENESSTSVAKNEVVEELKRIGAISHVQNLPPLSPVDTHEEVERKQVRIDKVRKMVDNHMIVAALIATVAFTAGFAMPGGYVSSGSPNAGTAVLSRNSIAFQTFVISDVVALLLSSGALLTYFISATIDPSEENKRNITIRAVGLNMYGLASMIVSFISGTYAVLHNSYALAIASSVVASLIVLIYSGILFSYRASRQAN